MTGLWSNTGAREKAHGKDGAARVRFGPTLGSVVLASLLFCEVASAMVGAETVFFSTIVGSWLVLPAVVGLRNLLDAGCFYMLISLGVVVIVSAAS